MPAEKKGQKKDEAQARAVEGTPEAQDQAREGEAEQAQAELDEQAKAADARAKQQDKASELKAVPEDAETPPTQKGTGEDTQYSVARLTEAADDFLGHPPHVVAGALSASGKEYLTIGEARSVVEKWLGQEVEYVHAEEA